MENNDTFYLYFMNMSRVNGYKGYVGFSLLELNPDILLVNNSMNNANISGLFNSTTAQNISIPFTRNFWFRVFTAGCYYLDEQTNEWSSNGMEILPDTNSTHTHCKSNHLTSFAGGFVVLPNEIRFDQVWAKAEFTKNPLIYATCITLVCLYIALALWARYQDCQDEKKMGVTLLNYENIFPFVIMGNKIESKYIYEIIVFTGARQNAGTDSKASCIMSSESTETSRIELIDSKRKLFNRAGIDSFILVLNKPLGSLSSIRIWHDNSGRKSPSWYLKQIIVHDLQTREKSYFLCDKWLALDKGDGLVDRLLPVSLSEQKNKFAYLFQKQTKHKLSDGHLWFSVFARPVQSAFNRLDRLTCCFVLLSITMLMNILYYGLSGSSSSNSNGLKIGPSINITPEQVKLIF
jgi:polycystin 1L2